MSRKASLLLLPLFLFSSLAAADLIPYSVQRVEAVPGSGFVKLVGPARIEVKGKTMQYKEVTYISIRNISSISSVPGVESGAVVYHNSEGTSESISVLKQSPLQVIEQIKMAAQPEDRSNGRAQEQNGSRGFAKVLSIIVSVIIITVAIVVAALTFGATGALVAAAVIAAGAIIGAAIAAAAGADATLAGAIATIASAATSITTNLSARQRQRKTPPV